MRPALPIILVVVAVVCVLFPATAGRAQPGLSLDAAQAETPDPAAIANPTWQPAGGEGAIGTRGVISATHVYLPFTPRAYSAGVNRPPYLPANPVPADGSVEQAVDLTLAWTGGDPDGDHVTYDVYLEADDDTPDVIVCDAVPGTTCTPGALDHDTHYYWFVVATDEHAATTAGAVWEFSTGPLPNDPPDAPSHPSPPDGARGQLLDLALSWIGGDPDADALVYDVYFEPGNSAPGVLLCGAVTETVCHPGALEYATQYHWQVVATDEHSASTPGPVWTFTTAVTTTLLDEDFEAGWDGWAPFLNYFRLAPGQWYWDETGGTDGGGGLTHDAYAVPPKEAYDALAMWLQPGAGQWTDYRLETKIILHTDSSPQGVWVRGQYQDAPGDPGGWVTGYYVEIGEPITGTGHFVRLQQLQTISDCWGASCGLPDTLYDFNNPHELTTTVKAGGLERDRWYTLAVEVRGDRIKAWLDGVLYIDYLDAKEPFLTGTIGLRTFEANTVTFDDVIVTPIE